MERCLKIATASKVAAPNGTALGSDTFLTNCRTANTKRRKISLMDLPPFPDQQEQVFSDCGHLFRLLVNRVSKTGNRARTDIPEPNCGNVIHQREIAVNPSLTKTKAYGHESRDIHGRME